MNVNLEATDISNQNHIVMTFFFFISSQATHMSVSYGECAGNTTSKFLFRSAYHFVTTKTSLCEIVSVHMLSYYLLSSPKETKP